MCQASLFSVHLYASQCWPISTSLCSRLSAFDMQAQRTITNTKWFDYKTNIEVRALTKRQPIQRYIAQSRLRWFGHLLRSPFGHPAHAIYTFNPRAGQNPVEPLARDGATFSPNTSNSWGQHWQRLPTSLSLSTRWMSTIVARAVFTPSWQEP